MMNFYRKQVNVKIISNRILEQDYSYMTSKPTFQLQLFLPGSSQPGEYSTSQ